MKFTRKCWQRFLYYFLLLIKNHFSCCFVWVFIYLMMGVVGIWDEIVVFRLMQLVISWTRSAVGCLDCPDSIATDIQWSLKSSPQTNCSDCNRPVPKWTVSNYIGTECSYQMKMSGSESNSWEITNLRPILRVQIVGANVLNVLSPNILTRKSDCNGVANCSPLSF